MWHYECNGQSVGPVSEEAVKLLIRDGVLARSTVVWKSGMSGWANADQTDLFRYFDTPPALTTKGDSIQRAVEHPAVNYTSKTERRSAQDDLGERYAEASSDASKPASFSEPTSEPSRRPYEAFAGAVKPLDGIVGHAQVAVIAFALVSAVTIVSDLASIGFIDHALGGSLESGLELDSQATAVDAFAQYASYAYLVALAWSAIVIGRWTYRAMKNVRDMGHETTVSPGWAVGWHFIPVALLWMPFRGMAQIWRGSVHGAPTGEDKLPSSMRFWWASWLFGNWFSFGALRMYESGMNVENFELVQMALGLGILGSGSHIVSAFLLLGLMKNVTRAQRDQPAMQFN